MERTALLLFAWAVLLLVAAPALWTGVGAIRRPPHAGGRLRGIGVALLGAAEAGAAVWLLGVV